MQPTMLTKRHKLLQRVTARGARARQPAGRRMRGGWARRDVLVGRADTALQTLIELPPARLTAALQGLLLLEAFVVSTLVITVANGLAYASPFTPEGGEDHTGTVFVATILLPSLILGVRRLRREALAYRAQAEQAEVQERRRRVSDRDEAYRILYLDPAAPLHIAEAAYIAAMKRAHPDVEGGSDAMARHLTRAIEIIREGALTPRR